jgi:hypothetical protein
MEYGALNITLKAGTGLPTDVPSVPAVLQDERMFTGAYKHPLLAPRGVCLIKDTLLVADTGQNRVFIWYKASQLGEQAEPDLVLGQIDLDATSRNAGATVSATSLQYPSGIWSDGERLIVADAWNHRVLIWQTWPQHDGQAADVVLGQPDFFHNEPNVNGLGAAPNAQSLYWPYGVYSDGKSLWIADTGNRRVLFFEKIPQENYTAASAVIGKATFEERDYEHQDAIWPYSVKIGPKGEMAIADTQYYRVLIWRHWQNARSQKADLIIGQADLDSNGMNQYGLFPQANTLSWCYDAVFYQKGILVADTGNSRVLCFEVLPLENNTKAQGLIGKPNFNMGSENMDTLFGTEKSLYWPFSISVEGNQVAIADTGNHRIILAQFLAGSIPQP